MGRRLLAVAAGAVLATVSLAACSSSAKSSTSNGDAPDGTFCALLVAFQASNQTLSEATSALDPAQNKAAVKQLVSQGQLLQKKAPADIKPDVAVVAAYFLALDQLLAKYDYDLGKLQADPTAIDSFQALSTDAVTSSRQQLISYAETTCGQPVPPTVTA